MVGATPGFAALATLVALTSGNGVAAVDLRSGGVIAFLEFQTAVEEIFDVQLLHGSRFPEVMGFQKETLHHTFIIPPATQDGPVEPGLARRLPA